MKLFCLPFEERSDRTGHDIEVVVLEVSFEPRRLKQTSFGQFLGLMQYLFLL